MDNSVIYYKSSRCDGSLKGLRRFEEGKANAYHIKRVDGRNSSLQPSLPVCDWLKPESLSTHRLDSAM